MKLSKGQQALLVLQKGLSFLFFPVLFPIIVFWMKHVRGYRIHAIRKLRKEFKQIKEHISKGLLVCPNHLTFIDSLLLIWAFSSPFNYLLNFRSFCWNLPKETHVSQSLMYRLICYIGKCILISPDPDRVKNAMMKASYLVNKGQYMMVFPEGTRSRTGRIYQENFVYGVGKLFLESQTDQLLCVYLRGNKQNTASKMPVKNEHFNITLKLISPNTSQKGRRAMRDVSREIIDSLVSMEEAHFMKINSHVG